MSTMEDISEKATRQRRAISRLFCGCCKQQSEVRQHVEGPSHWKPEQLALKDLRPGENEELTLQGLFLREDEEENLGVSIRRRNEEESSEDDADYICINQDIIVDFNKTSPKFGGFFPSSFSYEREGFISQISRSSVFDKREGLFSGDEDLSVTVYGAPQLGVIAVAPPPPVVPPPPRHPI